MRYVFLGNNERGCLCLEAVVKSGRHVVGVVTLPDEKQPGWSRNLAEVARHRNLPVIQPVNINDRQSIEVLRAWQPDVMILAGYNQLLKKEMRSLAACECINLHASPLPFYRGAAPLNWMLIHGETKGGMSILRVDGGIDTGDILTQEFFDISPEDDYATLLQLTLKKYPPLLLKTLEDIEGGRLNPRKQNPEEGSFFTKRYPEDGCIDWIHLSSRDVVNFVRALVTPCPGAFTMIKEHKIIIEKGRECERHYSGTPGRIAAHLKDGVVVICRDRGVLITHCRGDSGEIVEATKIMPPTGTNFNS